MQHTRVSERISLQQDRTSHRSDMLMSPTITRWYERSSSSSLFGRDSEASQRLEKAEGEEKGSLVRGRRKIMMGDEKNRGVLQVKTAGEPKEMTRERRKAWKGGEKRCGRTGSKSSMKPIPALW